MNPPVNHYRRRSVESILLGGALAALLLSGCTISSADPTTEGRQSSKMPTDSEQITTVIRSHLDTLSTTRLRCNENCRRVGASRGRYRADGRRVLN